MRSMGATVLSRMNNCLLQELSDSEVYPSTSETTLEINSTGCSCSTGGSGGSAPPSILDKLKAPAPFALARKRKVHVNTPPLGKKK